MRPTFEFRQREGAWREGGWPEGRRKREKPLTLTLASNADTLWAHRKFLTLILNDTHESTIDALCQMLICASWFQLSFVTMATFWQRCLQ